MVRGKNMPPKQKAKAADDDTKIEPEMRTKPAKKMSEKRMGSASAFNTYLSTKIVVNQTETNLYNLLRRTKPCRAMLNTSTVEAPFSVFILVMASFLEMDEDNRALLQAAIGEHITKRAVWQPVVSGTALFALDETEVLNVSDSIDQDLVWTEHEATEMYKILGTKAITNNSVGQYVVTNRVMWNLVCIMLKIVLKTQTLDIKVAQYVNAVLQFNIRQLISKETDTASKPTLKGGAALNTINTGALNKPAQMAIVLLDLKKEIEIKSIDTDFGVNAPGKVEELIGLAFPKDENFKGKQERVKKSRDKILQVKKQIIDGFGKENEEQWKQLIKTKIDELNKNLAWQHYGRKGIFKTDIDKISTFYMQTIMGLTDEAVEEMETFEAYVKALLQGHAVIAMQYLATDLTGKEQFKQVFQKFKPKTDDPQVHLAFLEILQLLKTHGVIGFAEVVEYIHRLIEMEDVTIITELRTVIPDYMLQLRNKLIRSSSRVEI
jgi:hypothetical protein